MKIVVMCQSARQCEMVICDQVPRVGDRVNMFYSPAPFVRDVIWWTSEEQQKAMGITHTCDVIVVVE